MKPCFKQIKQYQRDGSSHIVLAVYPQNSFCSNPKGCPLLCLEQNFVLRETWTSFWFLLPHHTPGKLGIQTADMPCSSGWPCLWASLRESITRGKSPSRFGETVNMGKSSCAQMQIQRPRCVPNTVYHWLVTACSGRLWQAPEWRWTLGIICFALPCPCHLESQQAVWEPGNLKPKQKTGVIPESSRRLKWARTPFVFYQWIWEGKKSWEHPHNIKQKKK